MTGADADIYLDLQAFAFGERAAAWSAWIPRAWPGLKVSRIGGEPSGLVRVLQVGQARFWSLIASSHTIVSDPNCQHAGEDTLAVILVREGVLQTVWQGERRRFERGEITVMQRSAEVCMEHVGLTRTIVCEIPVPYVEAHYRELFRLTGARIAGENAICQMMHALAGSIVRSPGGVSPEAGTAVLDAFLTLTNGMSSDREEPSQQLNWRVQRALQVIDMAIEDADITAQGIAGLQNISRRRLDQLFQMELSSTISAQILERRLLHAASALRDTRQRKRLIIDIAFDAGFKDSAHFSRAFKSRFGVSPRRWRVLGLAHGDRLDGE